MRCPRRPKSALRCAALTFALWMLGCALARSSESLEIAGTLGTSIGAVVADERYAYLGCVASVCVLDLTDPTDPQEIAILRLPGSIVKMRLHGDRVYVLTGFNVYSDFAILTTIDISDPTQPVILSEHELMPLEMNPVVDFEILGTTAIVVKSCGTVSFYDLTEPHDLFPFHVTDSDAPHAQSVELLGSLACIGTTNDESFDCVNPDFLGLWIIDLSTPSLPTTLAQYETADPVGGLALIGNQAILPIASQDAYEVVDLSNPAAPVWAGSIPSVGNAQAPIAGAAGFWTVEPSRLIYYDLASGLPESEKPLAPYSAYHDLAFFKHYALFADADTGLSVIETEPPNQGALVHLYEEQGYPWLIGAEPGWCYTLTRTMRLNILDTTNPALPRRMASELTTSTISQPLDQARHGSYLYVAEGRPGYRIYDLRDPHVPLLIRDVATSGSFERVAIDNNTLYGWDAGAGVLVLSLDEPASPTLRGVFPISGEAGPLAAAGNRVYAASKYYPSTVHILDGSDPQGLFEAGSIELTLNCFDLEAEGHLLFVQDGNHLKIYDVRNPSSPQLLSTLENGGETLQRFGTWLISASHYEDLKLIDISDPSNPVERAFYPDRTRRLAVAGGLIYTADYGGLLLLKMPGFAGNGWGWSKYP